MRELLGDRVTDVGPTRRMVAHRPFANGAEFRDYFKAVYGPTIAVYAGSPTTPRGPPPSTAALADLGDRYVTAGGA